MQTICIIDAGAGQKKMPLLFTPFTVTIKQVQGYCFFNSR